MICWQHPEHVFVNPENLIATAEGTNLIYKIGILF